MFSPRLAPVLPLTSANAVKSLPSLFLEPLTTCHFSIVRQEMLMRLIATELLSPPRTAPERLRSAPCGGTGTGFNALRGHILHQQPPKPSYCPPTSSTPQNPLTFGSPHKARPTSEPPPCSVPRFPQSNPRSGANDLVGRGDVAAPGSGSAGTQPLSPTALLRKKKRIQGREGARVPHQVAALVLRAAAPRLAPSRGPDSQRARLALGGAGTCCLNVNTSFIHLDWLSSAMLRYT